MRWKTMLPISIIGFLLSNQLNAQTPVDVAEGTLKVGIMSDGFLYYGFAEGDKLIFSFEETNGKELKEVEIVELYSISGYVEQKTKKITNKTITISRTAIYKFRFNNSSVLPKTCNYKIQRIPVSPATQNFNTTVYTDIISDTTYVEVIEDYLDRIDTVFITFQDRTLRVNPASNTGGNKTAFSFLLPQNIIGWSFYIGTGKEALQTYSDANKNLLSGSIDIVSKFPNYNILGAIALGRSASIPKLTTGASVNYWILDPDNMSLFTSGSQFKSLKNGKAINDYASLAPYNENLNFAFLNDHPTDALNVTVKISSVQTSEVWAKREARKMKITKNNRMHLKN